MEFPEPVISRRHRAEDEGRLRTSSAAPCAKLALEDPSFRVHTDAETGQTIISGMGELHLEIIVDRLLREFKVEANVGKPQVAYRETITTRRAAEGRYIRQTGGRGQYGHVQASSSSPSAVGTGFTFENQVVGGAIPREFIPADRQGHRRRRCQRGVLAGFPMVDVKVTLVDGSYHEVDSSEMAFNIAGSMAFQDAARKAGSILLEPVMAGRGRHARRLHGRRHRRPERSARQDHSAWKRAPGRRSSTPRFPRHDVRLRHGSPLAHAGPRDLHDAVRTLRRGPDADRRGDRRESQGSLANVEGKISVATSPT